MKDVIIPGRRIARELLIFVGCLFVGLLVNAYAIHKYNTDWKELVTTLHITFAVGVVIYILLGILRLVLGGVVCLFRRKPTENLPKDSRVEPMKRSAAR